MDFTKLITRNLLEEGARTRGITNASELTLSELEVLADQHREEQRALYKAAVEKEAASPRPASWVLVPCPDCDGEGIVEGYVGKYFDSHMECWYPIEGETECPRCNGAAGIEVTYDAPIEEGKEWREAA